MEKEIIKKIKVEEVFLPLLKPYILSFTTLKEFQSIVVAVELENGNIQKGEVVPLFGYSTETSDFILNYLNEKAQELIGFELLQARYIIAKDINEIPFSTSALLTAIDLLLNPLELNINSDKLQFVVPSSVKKIDELIQLHQQTCIENNGVLKIKLSGKPDIDIKAFDCLSPYLNTEKSILRLDANQAYSLEGGLVFFEYVSNYKFKSCIQYVEQPYPVEKKSFNSSTIEKFPSVPIMLDESIINNNDINEAYDMGIRHIKLKLYKQGGIKELIGCAKHAHQKGIDVIHGNGVAGKLTNAIENTVFKSNPTLFNPVLESNGFLKLV